MGYTTNFKGSFQLSRALTPAQIAYLLAFTGTRRMSRDAKQTEMRTDDVRLAVGLPIGIEGGFYVGGAGDNMGQTRSADVLDYNKPPKDQPSLWCQWTPNEAGTEIEWDGGEKFYEYTEWLNYWIENFLRPWGIEISGNVDFQGEDPADFGIVKIKKGKAVRLEGSRHMPR